MIDTNSFLRNFSEIFDDEPSITITLNTNFRDIEGWNSLIALSFMAMVDDQYKIKISGQEIKDSKTVGDLYKVALSKL
jgi:acyl carrier protein